MRKLVLYVHGIGGNAAESAHYESLFPARKVIGLDYRSDAPWDAGAEIRQATARLRETHADITLIANSLGAYHCIYAGIDGLIRRAYFISPVVDPERLILDRMRLAGVTEERLRSEGAVADGSGGELLWEYLRRVRERPVRWNAPTAVLYGGNDELIPRETVEAFVKNHGARLTILKNGEHWFHTEAQMRFLDTWIRDTPL